MSNTSDYKLDYLKIDELLPPNLQTDVNISVFNNSFNRFLTKDDNVRVTGTLGNQLTTKIIPEDTIHRQANQLQPLVFSPAANAHEIKNVIDININSFVDLLNKCKQMGIDPERFDKWGDCNQFVFAPPIDLDKFVNYKDYYWTTVTNPDYITINNKITRYKSIVYEANMIIQQSTDDDEIRAAQLIIDEYVGDVTSPGKITLAETQLKRDIKPIEVYNSINHKAMWIGTNHWVHKSDLAQVDDIGKPVYSYATPATLPIIEYFDDIEVNEWLRVEYNWLYRKNKVSPWEKSSTPPTNDELVARIPVIDTNTTANSFIVARHDALQPGVEFAVVQSATNDGVYKIISSTIDTITGIQTLIVNKGIKSSYIRSHRQFDYDEFYGHTTKSTLVAGVVYNSDCGVIIPLLTTSKGDPWLGLYNHWMLESMGKPVPTAPQVVNPDQSYIAYHIIASGFGVEHDTSVDALSIGYDDQVIFKTPIPYVLDTDDVQVYVNGVRQYGTYDELKSYDDALDRFDMLALDGGPFDYSTMRYIVVNDSIQITKPLNEGDTLLIKVGPAALSDKNRHRAIIRQYSSTDSDAAPNIVTQNIIEYRKHEPVKLGVNQYINFNMYEVSGKHSSSANYIFKYKEDVTAPVHSILNVRTPTANNNYIFEQLLFDSKLLCYKRAGILNTVWQATGTYVPIKVDEYRQPLNVEYYLNDGTKRISTVGMWDIPDPMRYNVMHECRNEVLFSEMFAHFNSIVSKQVSLPGINLAGSVACKTLDAYKYTGGTIKEHNGGFDIFVSAMHQNTISVLDLIRFAKTQYASCLKYLHQETLSAIIANMAQNVQFDKLLGAVMPVAIRNATNNIRLNGLYFDSTAIADGVGVQNWIATLPILGLQNPTKPVIIDDGNIRKVKHHDGHLSDFTLTPKDLSIIKQGLKVNESVTRPAFEQGLIWFNNGFYVCSADIETDTAPIDLPLGSTWYNPVTNEFATNYTDGWTIGDLSDAWTLLDFSLIFAAVECEIENQLYERAKDVTFNNMYNGLVDWTTTNDFPAMLDALETQYISYIKAQTNSIPVYDFDITNPFTYNYADLPTVDGITIDYQSGNDWAARWYTIYELQYGTAYPHLEPWILQGYTEKPTNWDQIYQGLGIRWKTSMWENIRGGVIHTSLANKPAIVPTYTVISVNDTEMTYGPYASGDLLPPYVSIPELINSNSLIKGPLTDISSIRDAYSFGQQSLSERAWVESIEYRYAIFAAMFKLQPIKTLYSTFGYDIINVNGLHVDASTQKVPNHTDTIFHGIANS